MQYLGQSSKKMPAYLKFKLKGVPAFVLAKPGSSSCFPFLPDAADLLQSHCCLPYKTVGFGSFAQPEQWARTRVTVRCEGAASSRRKAGSSHTPVSKARPAPGTPAGPWVRHGALTADRLLRPHSTFYRMKQRPPPRWAPGCSYGLGQRYLRKCTQIIT